MSSKNKQDIDDSEKDLSKYNWDGNALNRYPWVKYLAKRAFKHNPKFRTHVEYGYHMSGHRTITQSGVSRTLDQSLGPQCHTRLLGRPGVHGPLGLPERHT